MGHLHISPKKVVAFRTALLSNGVVDQAAKVAGVSDRQATRLAKDARADPEFREAQLGLLRSAALEARSMALDATRRAHAALVAPPLTTPDGRPVDQRAALARAVFDGARTLELMREKAEGTDPMLAHTGVDEQVRVVFTQLLPNQQIKDKAEALALLERGVQLHYSPEDPTEAPDDCPGDGPLPRLRVGS